MIDSERLIKAWEIFRESNPYEICSGREFLAIKEPEYCMGKMIEDTITLLKEHEIRELTIDEWKEWKNNPKRNPVCELWEYDTSPMWVLDPNTIHEPALLMGKLKLFTGKPTFEQCKVVKWK